MVGALAHLKRLLNTKDTKGHNEIIVCFAFSASSCALCRIILQSIRAHGRCGGASGFSNRKDARGQSFRVLMPSTTASAFKSAPAELE